MISASLLYFQMQVIRELGTSTHKNHPTMAFPNFFGRKGEKALDFLDNLEMAFLVSGRDVMATKVRAFSLVLREEARTWYQGLGCATTQDWEALKGAFLQRFQHQESPEEVWRKLQELQQASSSDYETYETHFVRLWDKWSASLGEGERAPNCLKKDCFLVGLFPILREKVKSRFPDTFEQAITIAREKHRKLKFQEQTGACFVHR